MIEISCDLHLHSCLSPCGSEDMTPNNIVRMAKLLGLDAIALTDHNSCANCAAVMEVGRREGLTVLPGMELTTSEDIHVLCLFSDLQGALAFESEVVSRSDFIPNRPDIFGRQILMNANDEVTGEFADLLIYAAGISITEAPALARSCGGVALPAHIDKPSNSILQTLGDFPPDHGFACAELRDMANAVYYRKHYNLTGVKLISNSDAHLLEDMSTDQTRMRVRTLDAKGVLEALSII